MFFVVCYHTLVVYFDVDARVDCTHALPFGILDTGDGGVSVQAQHQQMIQPEPLLFVLCNADCRGLRQTAPHIEEDYLPHSKEDYLD